MSWDIYVQDLPLGVSHVSEIPDDFVPERLGTRASIIAAISEVEPDADFSDPELGKIEGPGYSIDVSLGNSEFVKSFALHVYGGGEAPRVIAAILQRLGFRALDPGSEPGFLI